MSDATDLRLGAAGAALGAGALAVGCYMADNTSGIMREIDILLVTILITIGIEIGVFIFGIAYTFHRNFSIVRTGKAIESRVTAEVIPADIPAIRQGIPAIIRAIGRPARPLALPAANGPQSDGADRPPATGNGNGPGSHGPGSGAA